MKLNWGSGIALVYGAYVIFLLGFWAFASSQKVDLVASDYYDRTTRYQQQIDRLQRTKALKEKVQLRSENRKLFIDLSSNRASSGRISFYRPSDSNLDREVRLSLDERGHQVVPLADFASGMWRVFLEWESNGQSYFFEDILFVN